MRYRQLLALAAVYFLAWPAAADEKSDAKAVVEKAVKAHGGAETIEKFKSTRMTVKGTLTAMGMDIEVHVVGVTQMPDKYRNEIKLDIGGQKVEIVEVFDGKTAWMKAMGGTMELEGDQLTDKKEEAYHNYLETILPLARDKDLEVTLIGEEKVDGKPAAGIKIMKKGMKEYRMYFDKESGLLVKTWQKGKDMGGQEVDAEAYYRGYKDVQGVKQAMKLEVKHDGKKFIEAEVTEMKLGEKADAGAFEKP